MAHQNPKNMDPSKKSLRLLEKSLAKLTKESKVTQKPSTSKLTSTRKRGLKVDESHPKITTWLNAEHSKRQRRENKFPLLDVTTKSSVVSSSNNKSESKNLKRTPSSEKYGIAVPSYAEIISDQQKFEQHREKVEQLNKVASPKKNKSKSKGLKRHASFDKYGIIMPSFEKILADQEKFKQHEDQVKQFDSFNDDALVKALVTDCLEEGEKFAGELLDCRNLSIEELDENFGKHLETLRDIMEGKIYSERHNKFHKIFTQQSNRQLQCSSSLVVFTQDQNDHLLDLMKSKLDPNDRQLSYFFKVLLPELCLLIFMDVHKMTKTQATEYLETRPLDFE